MQRFDVRSTFQGRFTTRRASTKFIVVHHAAALYRQPTGLEDVQAIATYHVNTRGWGGIGYHVVLAEYVNGGDVARYDVSNLDLQRAHVWGRNDEAIGVCAATRFDGIPALKWLAALGETIREISAACPGAVVVGHTDIALRGYETTCPGSKWREWQPLLIAAIQNLVTPSAPASYRVIATAGAVVRQLPSANAARIRALPAGFVVRGVPATGARVTLPPFGSSADWIRLADNSGYVWANLLDRI